MDITNIEYGLPGGSPDETITRVTYATGQQDLYHINWLGGRPRTTVVEGGCSACGSKNAVYAFDKDGRVNRIQNARGYVTTFTFNSAGMPATETRHLKPAGCDPSTDSSLCRLSPAALASASLEATAATRTTSYSDGDVNWPDIATDTIRITTFVYYPV